MVAVTADEGSVGECPERSSLVLSLLIGQELRVIYASVISFLMELAKSESALLRVCKGIVDQEDRRKNGAEADCGKRLS